MKQAFVKSLNTFKTALPIIAGILMLISLLNPIFKNIMLEFLPAMAFYFGLKFTVIISFYIILFSILSGLFLGKILEE